MLESAIGRTQYVRGEKPPKKPVNFIRTTYPASGFADRIEELFVARDAIAHNHIWEAKITWGDDYGMKLVSAELRDGYGDDKKFQRVIDATTRTTKLLGINLFPTRICRADAVAVLKTAIDFLLFLENEDRRYFYFSPHYVKFRGDLRLFTELVASL
jgi:hypothetical protein